MIVGVDEVGRGCWAGPLVVGAVLLGTSTVAGLTDSKLLSKKRRLEIDAEVRTKARAIGLGWVSASEVDEIGLSEALRVATRRAIQEIQQVGVPFSEIIIDGTVNFLSDTKLEPYVTTLKKGDQLIPAISAASVVAKVARDAYMHSCDELYEGYGFAGHVGYGTSAHRAAISTYGVTPEHRLSIKPLEAYRLIESPQISKQTATPTTRHIGDASEEQACHALLERGHTIIAKNWRTKICEIDIVSILDDTYYFTEVKHRKTSQSGSGLEAITAQKLHKMKLGAQMFTHMHQLGSVDQRLVAIATTGDPPMVENIELL